jgi:hypothetical protein
MHRIAQFFIITCALALIPAISACKRKSSAAAAQTTLSASLAGRQIRAYIEGPASIESGPEAASVTFGNHTVRIERERLLLDGQESGQFPVATMRLTLFVTNSTLAAVADGNNIVTTKIEKSSENK